jgi:hypothetical protein
MFKNKAILLFTSALLALPGAIQAQGVTPTAAGKGGTVSSEGLVKRYQGLAGGEANATSLVNGLRTGADITLTGAAGPDVTACDKTADVCVKTERCRQRVLKPKMPQGLANCECAANDHDACNAQRARPADPDTFSPRPAAPMGLGNVTLRRADGGEAEAKCDAGAQTKSRSAISGKRAGGEGWGEIAKSYGFD